MQLPYGVETGSCERGHHFFPGIFGLQSSARENLRDYPALKEKPKQGYSAKFSGYTVQSPPSGKHRPMDNIDSRTPSFCVHQPPPGIISKWSDWYSCYTHVAYIKIFIPFRADYNGWPSAIFRVKRSHVQSIDLLKGQYVCSQYAVQYSVHFSAQFTVYTIARLRSIGCTIKTMTTSPVAS